MYLLTTPERHVPGQDCTIFVSLALRVEGSMHAHSLPRAVEHGTMSRDVPPASCHLVVFLLAEQHYALPLAMVERVLPVVAVSPLPQAPPMTLGMINLHGTVMPVLDLRHRFGFPPHEYG